MQPQFPMYKLVTLLARQVTTPVARRLKDYATGHEWFRRRVCMALGRGYHVAQLRVRMWSLALKQPRVLPAISDQAALDSGVTLMGEIIVFGLGTIILLCELNRQGNIQEMKEQYARSEWAAIQMQLEELKDEVAKQQEDIDRLMEQLRRILEPPPPEPANPAAPAAPPEDHG